MAKAKAPAKTPTKTVTRLEDLTLDPRNPNKHTERGMKLLERSIERLGAGRGIAVSSDGVVLAGNATVETAIDRGLKARVEQVAGDELLVVQRVDLDPDSPEAIEMRLADNRVGQANLDWDHDVLSDARAAKQLDGFFEKADADALLGAEAEPEPIRTKVVEAVAGAVVEAQSVAPSENESPSITLVFKAQKECDDFLTSIKVAPGAYVDGPMLFDRVRQKARKKGARR